MRSIFIKQICGSFTHSVYSTTQPLLTGPAFVFIIKFSREPKRPVSFTQLKSGRSSEVLLVFNIQPPLVSKHNIIILRVGITPFPNVL